MSTIVEVLHRHGYRVSEDDVAEALDQLLSCAPVPNSLRLTADEHKLLVAGGLDFTHPTAGTTAAAALAAAYAALVGSSLTVADAAIRMAKDRSRVQRAITAGSLYAIRIANRHLLPVFQFGPDHQPLPGFAGVLGALPTDLDPLEVEGFFVTESPDLLISEIPSSPRDWLLAGKPAAVVVTLATALDQA